MGLESDFLKISKMALVVAREEESSISGALEKEVPIEPWKQGLYNRNAQF